ncbi:MAG: acyl dehydratase [Halioglobus sp.]|jgi:acyl dehydratase
MQNDTRSLDAEAVKMTPIHYKDETALQALVSQEFGNWSHRIKVDQNMIDQYAELSGDHMWLHVDIERCAKESPFGSTIAHGFLILSLLPKMNGGGSKLGDIAGFSHIMNYGSDKLRFLTPVPVDSEIHLRNRIKGIDVSEKKTKIVLENQIYTVGSDTPALVYELMFVYL